MAAPNLAERKDLSTAVHRLYYAHVTDAYPLYYDVFHESRDPSLRTVVALADGRELTGLALQRIYLDRVAKLVDGRDPEVDGEPVPVRCNCADDQEIGLEQAPVLETDLRTPRRARDQVAPFSGQVAKHIIEAQLGKPIAESTALCIPIYVYLSKNGKPAGPINLFAPAPVIGEEPAPTVEPAPMVTGATSTQLEPMWTSASMVVRCLLAPS